MKNITKVTDTRILTRTQEKKNHKILFQQKLFWNKSYGINMATMAKLQQICRGSEVTASLKRCSLKMDLHSHEINNCKADTTHQSLCCSFLLLHFLFHNHLSIYCFNSWIWQLSHKEAAVFARRLATDPQMRVIIN